MDEGDGVAGVGQQVVLNANLEKVGHREVLGRHLGIPTSFFYIPRERCEVFT